jgi:hypothetical protein
MRPVEAGGLASASHIAMAPSMHTHSASVAPVDSPHVTPVLGGTSPTAAPRRGVSGSGSVGGPESPSNRGGRAAPGSQALRHLTTVFVEPVEEPSMEKYEDGALTFIKSQLDVTMRPVGGWWGSQAGFFFRLLGGEKNTRGFCLSPVRFLVTRRGAWPWAGWLGSPGYPLAL